MGRERPVAVVTGASRGIGAETALALASAGYDVAITYRNKASRAEAVVREIEERGGRAVAMAADLTVAPDRARLAAEVAAWRGGLHVLVLNASGGLERDRLEADPAYPYVINRDAQGALLDLLLPLMAPGSTVVFVTSHWAHLYGQVEQLPAYDAVAASKWSGERLLRARLPELVSRGVRLLVVTGDLVEGTITPRLLERRGPGVTDDRRTATGGLPTTREFGEAIARAATDFSLPTGHTVVVGGSLDSVPRITS